MAGEVPGTCDQDVIDALQHLEAALALLDGAGAPAQIGAHVDLAICQLRDAFAIELEVADIAQADGTCPTD